MAGVAATVPRSGSVSPTSVDWRKNCPGVNAKLKHIINNELLTDVIFMVGSNADGEVEMIKAHRLMLAMFSNVFEAMFMGEFIEKSTSLTSPIELPDIRPLAFKTMLKFIYQGEFDRTLSTTDVLGTLYAAKKYDIAELEIECLRFLKRQISEDNAVTIFQAAQLFDEKELRDDSYAFLKRNFDIVMKKNDFLNITMTNLFLFLRDDDTFASELAIFHGVLRWAESECAKLKIDRSIENQRLVMMEALPLIRFPVITSEDIALEVIPTGILSPEECTLLLQHKVVTPDSRALLPSLPFNDQRRSCSAYKATFYEEMKGMYVDLSSGWYNRFTVDQPISIVSFGFYGPHSKDNASYNVEIKILRDDSVSSSALGEAKYKDVIVKRREIFHVKFPHPVPVQPRTAYRAWFLLEGPVTCHGFSSSNTMDVVVPVNTRYESVKFTYAIVGANQLPEIMFHA